MNLLFCSLYLLLSHSGSFALLLIFFCQYGSFLVASTWKHVRCMGYLSTNLIQMKTFNCHLPKIFVQRTFAQNKTPYVKGCILFFSWAQTLIPKWYLVQGHFNFTVMHFYYISDDRWLNHVSCRDNNVDCRIPRWTNLNWFISFLETELQNVVVITMKWCLLITIETASPLFSFRS